MKFISAYKYIYWLLYGIKAYTYIHTQTHIYIYIYYSQTVKSIISDIHTHIYDMKHIIVKFKL